MGGSKSLDVGRNSGVLVSHASPDVSAYWSRVSHLKCAVVGAVAFVLSSCGGADPMAGTKPMCDDLVYDVAPVVGDDSANPKPTLEGILATCVDSEKVAAELRKDCSVNIHAEVRCSWNGENGKINTLQRTCEVVKKQGTEGDIPKLALPNRGVTCDVAPL